ncbi:GYD domain-containing protein [Paraburkholderia graminis]|jgi:uncharacterized protein with GYD domain|uniref:GYD domain-containing protein n=1 Tax=Paraburkholderia graminis TaxID=60548 RepID=UPI0038B775DC
MSALLLFGKFTPEFWARLKNEDPQVTVTEIRRDAEAMGCRLTQFFFALDEFDFYAILESESAKALSAVRHQLMSRGSYLRLHGDALATYAETFPISPT